MIQEETMSSQHFREHHPHLNCSETMFHYGNLVYKIGLDKKALQAMAGFGGGIFEEDLCGIVSGGVAIISLVFTKESPQLKDAVIEFKKRIKDAFSSIRCQDIKPLHRKDNNGCSDIIIQAMDIMTDVIDGFLKP